ncbi:MAG: LysR family transcriptional regulator [Deltaproteobacteria bacterium]|nr:LysR family transcriptional regulator [Deltaproteobacteria bacterium]
MERSRRIANLWNWLPAFRVVAETQHLPTASRALAVSSSALSRTIRLLEDDLGTALFHRVGRGLELNPAGERLLAAVRDAMRMVHEATLELDQAQYRGPIYVASAGAVTETYVLPALIELRRRHEGLVPHLRSESGVEADRLLLRGVLDVAFSSRPGRDPELCCERICELSNGVWCGRGHPLFGREEVGIEEVLEHAFAAPLPDEEGRTHEGWPEELVRKVGMAFQFMHHGVEVCARGNCWRCCRM